MTAETVEFVATMSFPNVNAATPSAGGKKESIGRISDLGDPVGVLLDREFLAVLRKVPKLHPLPRAAKADPLQVSAQAGSEDGVVVFSSAEDFLSRFDFPTKAQSSER